MDLMKYLLSILTFVFLGLFFQLSAQPADPFHWDYDHTKRTVAPGGSIPLEVIFEIPGNGHMYRDKMSISFPEGESEAKNFSINPLEFSPSMTEKDPFLGETEVFRGGAVIKTNIHAKSGMAEGDHTLRMELTYQGCSENLCYRLMHKEIILPVRITVAGAASSSENEVAKTFREKGFLFLLLLTFLGGLASDFTPCVLPIIPITLAFIGVRRSGSHTGRNFMLSLLFALSMAFSYAILGLLAAILGKGLGFLFQSPYFLLFSSLLSLVFALSLFGLFEIQFPEKVRNFVAKTGGEGPVGSILAGLTVGFLAAPCVGPLIASLLLYVAQDRNLPRGFFLLFSYGLGMGSLFMVIGTFFHQMASKIHGGPFTLWIKRVFAVLLLIPALYYGWVAYGHIRKAPEKNVMQENFWNLDEKEAFAKAASEGKPLFMDFFATWCLPCLEMEAKTFSNEKVQNYLSENFVPIKIDCTHETPQCKAMTERYSVIGWPTFLLLTPQGVKIDSIVGKNLSASELLQILEMSRTH